MVRMDRATRPFRRQDELLPRTTPSIRLRLVKENQFLDELLGEHRGHQMVLSVDEHDVHGSMVTISLFGKQGGLLVMSLKSGLLGPADKLVRMVKLT